VVETIGIIGAGFAGLSTGKVLQEFGYQVTLFESESEVGGVWASSRRYPGLETQNVRSTYCLSDFPYPADYPEWPSGRQVQEYLDSYVDFAGLRDRIRFGTRVVSATQDEQTGRWTLTTDSGDVSTFDFLVVCNGVYSQPSVPRYEGVEAFEAAGGHVWHTTEFNELQDAHGKNVVVVGYGKSSCDVANACVGTAESVTLVARRVLWKIPRKLKNVVNFKMLFLTRMGEGLFPYVELEGFESFLHGSGKGVRNSMVRSVQGVIAGQQHLEELGLEPDDSLETIFQGSVGLETPGFFGAVTDGRLRVERDTAIARLEPGSAVLENGARVPCDIVVCGTGFVQQVPFLEDTAQKQILGPDGKFRLYRHMLPVGMRNIAFNGYNSSFFSQLNAEIGALWLADHLKGGITLPSEAEQNAILDHWLGWQEERTAGHTSSGTNLVPFSIHNVDELLADMGMKVGSAQRSREWLLPVNPLDYAKFTRKLKQRHGIGSAA
jgi:dimethylaniline monooxygenase (N-oxide forming)